jgi:hypothetical protein
MLVICDQLAGTGIGGAILGCWLAQAESMSMNVTDTAILARVACIASLLNLKCLDLSM